MRFDFAAATLLATLASGMASAQTPPAGFYIRGDVGAGFGQNVTFSDTSPAAPNCDLCGATLPARMSDSVVFGGGVGYRLSPLWRLDLTVDDIPSLHGGGTANQVPPTSGSAPFSSLVAMANGYLDLAGWQPAAFGPFQPYLTAGIGVARNDLGTFSGTSAGFAVSENGDTTTNFAWGVGAGIAYPMTANLTLEVGYKYLDLGEFRTGTAVTVAGAPLPPVTASKSSDLGVHTIMAGLRFAF